MNLNSKFVNSNPSHTPLSLTSIKQDIASFRSISRNSLQILRTSESEIKNDAISSTLEAREMG